MLTLQEQIIQSNQILAQYHANGINKFLLGNYVEIEAEHEAIQEICEKNAFPKDNHCLNQETKRLKVNHFEEN